jgi:Origin recognition complex subunit 6 (ORC6)
MNVGVKECLSALLPTVATIPPVLVSKASELVDVSRHKFHLGSNEEGARVWLASCLAIERYLLSALTNKRLSTSQHLPPLTLEGSHVPMRQSAFETLLGKFRIVFPETKTHDPVAERRQIEGRVRKLCISLESDVPQAYLIKAVEQALKGHSTFSIETIVAATFLVVHGREDITTRKIKESELVGLCSEVSSKELRIWKGRIEQSLEKVRWFENNSVESVSSEWKEDQPEAKNVRGLGTMVILFRHSLL